MLLDNGDTKRSFIENGLKMYEYILILDYQKIMFSNSYGYLMEKTWGCDKGFISRCSDMKFKNHDYNNLTDFYFNGKTGTHEHTYAFKSLRDIEPQYFKSKEELIKSYTRVIISNDEIMETNEIVTYFDLLKFLTGFKKYIPTRYVLKREGYYPLKPEFVELKEFELIVDGTSLICINDRGE